MTIARSWTLAGLAAAIVAASLAGCSSPSAAPPPSPPVPTPTSTGPKLVVTMARGCPATDRGEVVSAAPGSGRVLAPPHPMAGLICRYSGFGSSGRPRLLASAHLGAQHAGTIADLLTKLPIGHGTTACFNDDGARDVILLSYAHQAPATVSVDLSGCDGVTNGWFSRVSTSDLTGALSARVGAPSS